MRGLSVVSALLAAVGCAANVLAIAQALGYVSRGPGMPDPSVLGLVGATVSSLAVLAMGLTVVSAQAAESRREREFRRWLDVIGGRCDRAIEARVDAVAARVENAREGNANALDAIMNRLRSIEERAFGA